MCNLSRKEGSSLFAVLAKRQRKTLPKNLHLHAEQLISFWPLDMQFRKQTHQLNKKRVNGAKTEPCRWRWPRDCKSLLAVCLGDTAQGSECHVWNPTPEVNALCSMFQRFLWSSTDWMLPGVLFFHSRSRSILYTHSPQGKMTLCCPHGAERHQSCGGKKDLE